MIFENDLLKSAFIDDISGLYQHLTQLKEFIEERGYTLSDDEMKFCNDAESLIDDIEILIDDLTTQEV